VIQMLNMPAFEIFERCSNSFGGDDLIQLAGSINLCWSLAVVRSPLRLQARGLQGEEQETPERPRPPGKSGAGAAASARK